jgi:hypothetical protein
MLTNELAAGLMFGVMAVSVIALVWGRQLADLISP